MLHRILNIPTKHASSIQNLSAIAVLLLILLLYSDLFFRYDTPISKTLQFSVVLLLTTLLVVLLTYSFRQREKIKSIDQTSKLLSRQQAKNLRDLDIARQIQQSLLGDHTFFNKDIKIIANCKPAEKIGGDFYSIREQNFYDTVSQSEQVKGVIKLQNQLNRQLGVCIGDVAGHGIASALVMLLAKSLLDQLLQQNISPAKIFQIANKQIKAHTEKSDISFVTAAIMLINLDTRSMIYSKAGHTDAIHIRPDGTISTLTAEGVFLGMFDNIEFEEIQINLEPKDKLILYTDGITETRSANGEIYGIKRFIQHLETVHTLPLEKLIGSIHHELHAFSGKTDVSDDATLILIEMN